MEFVGKSVNKKLNGFGVFKGYVKSYDESSGFFEIKYEDGDFEELDFSKVASLLEEEKEAAGVSAAGPVGPKPRLGRKLKKRRRAEPKKPESGESGNSGVVEANGYLDMNRNVDLNDGFVGDLRGNVDINVDLNETLEKGSGAVEDLREGVFDLNAGFNFDLNEEEEEGNPNPNPNYNHNNNSNNNNNLSVDFEGKKRGCIDLNLDVSGDVDENFKEVDLECKVVETQKRECGFDLNLGIDEEIKDEMDVGFEGQMEETTNFEIQRMEEVEKSHIESAIRNGKLQGVHVSNDSCSGLVEKIEEVNIVSCEDFRAFDSVGVVDVKDVKEDFPEVIDSASVYKEESGSRRRGRRRRKLPDNLNSTPEVTVLSDANAVGDDSMVGSGSRRRGRRRKLADNLNSTPDVTVLSDANAVGDDCMVGGGSQRRGRRRKLADNLNSIPEKIILLDANVVREDCTVRVDGNLGDIGSSYREVSASASARNRRNFLDNGNSMQETTVLRRSARRGSAKNNMLKDLSMSPVVSALTEEKPVKSHHEWPEEPVVLPPKLQLPPSSQNLNLSGIPVLDLFSVYACLRSFSTLLFLSPFGLEEFVTALKGNSPSSLFDFIHVSILETLRKHLEHLSNEGSESASNCLRSLDWGLLDLITWPVFMVEYLLIHGSGLKPGFDLSRLNLFRSDYHKQPVSVKLEMLQCLCDDMIEVEAIRSELNRRSSGAEPDMDFDRNMSLGACKKRKIAMDVSGNSCLTEDADDDWNSDECCLCKMDGNLICCDGCPAAYHAKCVGVANNSLPEGDWYCPECAIDKQKPWMKSRKLIRGAELLGVDPYNRLYFSSCGYLLVSDACDLELSFNYYQRDDLSAVIEMLKSSEMIYGSILEAIHKHWDIPVTLYGASHLSSVKHATSLDMSIPACTSASLETCATKIETADGQNLEKFANRCCGHLDFEFSKSVVSPTCMSSEGSAETTQINLGNQNFQKGPDCSNRSAGFSNETEVPEKSPLVGDFSMTSNILDVKQEKNRCSPPTRCPSSAVKATDEVTLQVQPRTEYMNYYSFGYTSASIAEVLLSKSSDKTTENSIKSDEEMALAQMKVILKNSNRFRWSSIPSLNAEVQKEKCGWCFSCRATTNEPDCLFNMSLGPVQEGSESEVISLKTKRNRKGYLVDLICHILLIEDRLQGLLLGPWLNPHYTKLWRKSILKASDIATVKHLLLKLEANVRRLALSADWVKHVDSGVTMGSSSHIVTASSRASLKNGIGRKRVRSTECESNPCANPASGLGMFWWRGGRLSRRLFSWKVLPCSLTSKAARQAGCMKIAGILYPENSDFAKRSKHVTWRAAVESSVTVEQLALQVREFDSNIRWDEIQNTHPLSMLDKELRKSFRLFKKVIIRRKCVEEEGTKYLLDFGKRRSIPEIVLKNGSMIEESSSERKKYWLNESYVPFYLLKSFEERKIARRSSMMNSGKLSEASVLVKKPLKQRGFSYLFARAERSEYHQCGHCNKDVPIREAVCCQNCKGFFHKRHVRKSAGAIIAKCIYTCHRCHYGKNVKTNAKTVKTDTKRRRNSIKNTKVLEQKSKKVTVVRNSVRLKNGKKALRGSQPLQSRNKKVTVVPLRCSARKAKQKALQIKKVVGRKRGRPSKSKKGANKKPKRGTLLHKKRTDTCHSYWRNGLLLSRNSDDERVTHFREKSLIAPSESAIDDQPKCHLCCEAGYTSISNYISCEICGEWFHGDAFGLDAENINKLIGFRCHVCLKKTPPICPHAATTSREVEIAEVQNDVGTELPKEETDGILHQEEDHPGSLLVSESVHVEGQLGTALDSNQSFVSEPKLEAENGHALANVIENTDAIQTLYENLKPDLLTSRNESHMVEENTIKSGDDAIVTSDDAAQLSSCKVGVDFIETGLAALGPDGAEDSLTTPSLKSPIDGSFIETIKMQPQSFMASNEL